MSEITYAQALKDAMSEEMRKDKDIFLIGEDVGIYGGVFGVSLGMLEEFGEDRIIDTPISELGYVGAGVGAAMVGMRPIVEIMFSDFLTVAYDQIANQAAKIRYMFGGHATIPMVLRAPAGSGTGAAAQHSQSPEAWITNVPGLKIVTPSTPYDAKGLLKAAIRDNNPVVFFEQKLLYRKKGEVPDDDYIIEIGKADTKKEGSDISVITYGRMVPLCLEVAEILEKEGISLEVVDLRTLVPMDKEAVIESVKKTKRALIVHEACKTSGFGAEISSVISESDAFYYLDAPITRCAGLDVPIPYCVELEKNIVPTQEKLLAAARQMMK
jgi:acetoin:2,6-dichlorophenolindophenol oxidoreductase subunit beta